MSYSEIYAFCLGEVGISKDEYFRLTQAETMGIVAGFVINRDVRSNDIRSLYTLTHNINAKHTKRPYQLWPLSIDSIYALTMDEIYERNKKILGCQN